MQATVQRNRFVRLLTPTALAVLSVEIGDVDPDMRTPEEDRILDDVDAALHANCGEAEADQLRTWVRVNVA